MHCSRFAPGGIRWNFSSDVNFLKFLWSGFWSTETWRDVIDSSSTRTPPFPFIEAVPWKLPSLQCINCHSSCDLATLYVMPYEFIYTQALSSFSRTFQVVPESNLVFRIRCMVKIMFRIQVWKSLIFRHQCRYRKTPFLSGQNVFKMLAFVRWSAKLPRHVGTRILGALTTCHHFQKLAVPEIACVHDVAMHAFHIWNFPISLYLSYFLWVTRNAWFTSRTW